MTIKQQISHRVIQKSCHLHDRIFHSIPFHLCHFVNVTLSVPIPSAVSTALYIHTILKGSIVLYLLTYSNIY